MAKMMWQGKGCVMYEIFVREFLGRNFVSGLRTLKLIFFKLKKLKTLTTRLHEKLSKRKLSLEAVLFQRNWTVPQSLNAIHYNKCLATEIHAATQVSNVLLRPFNSFPVTPYIISLRDAFKDRPKCYRAFQLQVALCQRNFRFKKPTQQLWTWTMFILIKTLKANKAISNETRVEWTDADYESQAQRIKYRK